MYATVAELYGKNQNARTVLDFLINHQANADVIYRDKVSDSLNMDPKTVFNVFLELERLGCGVAFRGRGRLVDGKATAPTRFVPAVKMDELKKATQDEKYKPKPFRPLAVKRFLKQPQQQTRLADKPAFVKEAQKPLKTDTEHTNILWLRDDFAVRIPSHLTEQEKSKIVDFIKVVG